MKNLDFNIRYNSFLGIFFSFITEPEMSRCVSVFICFVDEGSEDRRLFAKFREVNDAHIPRYRGSSCRLFEERSSWINPPDKESSTWSGTVNSVIANDERHRTCKVPKH